MKPDELKRLLSDVTHEAASAAESRDTTWFEDRQTLRDIAESLADILERLDKEDVAQEAPQKVAMNAEQRLALGANFLRWSGGFPPDSTEEIFTYCELSLPMIYDKEEARLILKAWMEESWKQDPVIENPMESFKVFRHVDEK